MQWGRIGDGDSLFRHSRHPVSFQGKVFSEKKILTFYEGEDGLIEASLAWERFMPTQRYIHEHGCRMAAATNGKNKALGKYKPSNRHVYCGAYRLAACSVRSLVGTPGLEEITSSDVIHQIERGEISHAAVKIYISEETLDREGTKTAILDRLWNSMSGPVKHICDYDADLNSHPGAVLVTAPRGPYIDMRSSISRAWYVIRFHIYRWIWETFCKSDEASVKT